MTSSFTRVFLITEQKRYSSSPVFHLYAFGFKDGNVVGKSKKSFILFIRKDHFKRSEITNKTSKKKKLQNTT
jgi:hypothetical protein